MASILFKIVKFATPNSNATICKIKKHFLNFLFHFWNLHQILNIFKKKDDRHSSSISEITDREKFGQTTL